MAEKRTNIVLTGLNENTLKIILKVCKNNNIHFTFDKDYYPEEDYDIISLIDDMLMKSNKISSAFKPVIERQYVYYLNDIEDEEKLKEINEIEYV
jgi:hypothetical protein